MSYCRFGEADVYVFTSSQGIECCMCHMQPRVWVDDPTREFLGGYLRDVEPIIQTVFGGPDANAEMIAHLQQHRDQGDYIPDEVFALLADPADAVSNQRIFAEYRETR